MPLGHILAPLIAKKTAEIERELAPTNGYLQQQPPTLVALPPGVAPVSEHQAYAGLDKSREAALAGDRVRTRALEMMGSRGTVGEIDKKSRGSKTQVGDTNIDRNARIDRLGNKPEWTGDDIADMTDLELAKARLLRKQREAEGAQPGAIHSPGYLPKVGVSGTKRNPRIEVERTGIPLEGVHTGTAYTGPALGNSIDPGYKPVPLGDMLRNTTPEEAAQIIANEMQKKRPGYLPST